MVTLIYIGQKYYFDSGTSMSSLYRIVDGVWYRRDWGDVTRCLLNGTSIQIVPATKAQLKQADEYLRKM